MRRIIEFGLGPIGVAVFGLAAVPIMAWNFTSEDVGRLTLFQVVISFSLLFLSFGLDQAYVRNYFEASDKVLLLKSAVYPGLFAGAVFIVIWCSASPFLRETPYFGESVLKENILLAVAIISSYLINFISLSLRMELRGFEYSTAQVFPKFLFVLLLLIFHLIDLPESLKNLIVASVISVLVTCCLLIAKTWSVFKAPFVNGYVFSDSLRLMKYGAPLMISSVIFWGLISLDRILLSTYSSLSEVGLYSVSVSFAGPATIILAIFSTILGPMIYSWLNEPKFCDRVIYVAEVAVVVVVFLWCLVGLLSWGVAYFLPVEYDKVKYILLLCMGYPFLYGLAEVGGVGINVTKKTGWMVYLTSVCLVVNVVLNLFLIPRHGATGAAAASAITFFVYFVGKCEISAYLWVRVAGFKDYLFVFLALANCLLICFGFIGFELFCFLNLLLIIFTAYGYRGVIRNVFKMYA